MTRFAVRLLILIALVMSASLLAWACGKSTDPASTAPDPVTKVDTFSGSLTRSASVIHTFTVSVSGAVAVGLTDVAPLSTLAIGVSIGTWNGTSCTSLSTNDNARMGTTALSGTAQAGNYCVRVYDSGNVPENTTVTYTLQVGHS
jgi:hypothetical protein